MRRRLFAHVVRQPRPSYQAQIAKGPARLALAFAGLAALLGVATPASAATFTVNSTADTTDGVCDAAPDCTLREAIAAANGLGGADTIDFAIAGAGPHTITLTSLLPAVTGTTDINGYSQPLATANSDATATNADLRIVLDVAGLARGLDLSAASSRVRGLVLQDYDLEAIRVGAAADTSTIDGNFIGTTVDGTASSAGAFPGPEQQRVGVVVLSGATGVVIGGTTPAARNLISGNTIVALQIRGSSNFVQGNLIGTDAAGTAAVPNGLDNAPNNAAIQLVGASSTLIGGATAAHRNVISGNAGDGLQTYQGGATNTIQGNYFGLDHSGTAPLPNARHAVVFYARGGAASAGNVVADNVIANQPRKGIAIDGPNFTGTLVDGNLIGTAADGITPMGNGFGAAPPMFGPDAAIDILFGATATVSNNRLLYNFIGLQIRNEEPGDPGGTGAMLLPVSAGNCLVFNGSGAINTTVPLASNTFEDNWWGSSDGPSGAGPGSGDSVSTGFDFDPFLTAAPAGCPSYGEASGTKFTDLTGDGPSGDDTPLAGVTINLWLDGGDDTFDEGVGDDTLSQTDVTDGSGEYAFLGLEPGETYFVDEDESTLPGGFVQTYGGDNFAGGVNYYTLDVVVDSVAANLDFGNAQTVDLSITKTAAPNAVSVGDNVVFTVTVSNAGPGTAANVVVTDVLPPGFSFVSTAGGCTEDPNGVPTCTLGTILSGGSAQYTITASADSPPGGMNTASVTTTSPDLEPANDTAAASVTIAPIRPPISEIPTLGTVALAMLALLIAAGGMALVWRQS
jgi:uncharacterized repeat protein (TIGR01451 family)/CSLREA domain-containing protein